jgi:hypothetical protein
MFSFEVDPAKLRVDIGMPVHTGFVPFPTAAALVDTTRECMRKRLLTRHIAPCGSSIVIDARSAVVDEFLRGDGTHLFWIDSDMHWHPRDFVRLVSLCTQVDVVGATYTQKAEPARYMIREPKNTPNDFGLIEVAGLGLGFTCMKREVVEAVAAGKPLIRTNSAEIREVFSFGRTAEGHRLGEDMKFFEDIRAAGFTVWLDPMVNIKHVGLKMYGGDVETALQGL